MLSGKGLTNEKVAIILRIVTPRPSSLLHRLPLAPTLLTFLLEGSRFWMAIHPIIIIGFDLEHAGDPVVAARAGGGLAGGKKQEKENEDQVNRLQLC